MRRPICIEARGSNLLKPLIRSLGITFILTLLLINQSVASVSQIKTETISITARNQTLDQIINQLESRTSYRFAYNRKTINVNQSFSVSVEGAGIQETLKQLFANKNIRYTLVNHQIILSPEETGSQAQQNHPVSGTVSDESGNPLPGVTIILKGTTTGTITDANGKFTITNVPSSAILQFSFVGMKAVELPVGTKTTFKVKLEETAVGLDEVVAVGYGVQKKTDVTGAMVSVGEKELKAMPVKDALQAMQGKTAGVDITSNQRPGENGSIKIRGIRSLNADQDPLYVVDGMVIQSGGIDNINPSDIQSIDILKDASATAIYGSRGANGVILVTTKKGKEGKITLNYSGSLTLQKLYDVTEYMNTSEWLDYARLAKYNMGTYASSTPSYAADYSTWGSVTASFANIEKGWNDDETEWNGDNAGTYDWGKYGKRTGIITEHTISASGGTSKFSGYGSFGYLKQEGTIKDQAFERYTAKTSFSANPFDWIKLGETVNVSWGSQDYGYKYAKSTTGAGDYYSALKSMLPWTVPYDEDGDYIRNPAAGDTNIINPINETKYNVNQRQTLRLSGNVYGQFDIGSLWKPLKGVSYRIQFGPEFKRYRVGTFYDADGINGDGNNVASYSNAQTLAWTLDNLIYYNHTFNKNHKLDMTLMQSSSKYHYESVSLKAIVATSEELWYNLSSDGDISSYGSGLSEKQMESYMARANYSFKDKYLVTASLRWDGASQLADGNKWASFPSIALGWRMEEEPFMKNLTWIDALKFRLGYGVTGNSAISAYATKGAVTTLYYNWGTTSSSVGYVASDPSAKSPAKMANSDLGWEKTAQYNIGIDYSLWHGRLSGTLDGYKTATSDLLMVMSIPSLTGYTSTYANVGKTGGWGLDFQINSINLKTTNFQWATNITWSMDRNKIKELANGNTEDTSNKWFVGKPIGVYYDYVYDGIWKTDEEEEAESYGREPGQIKVKDLNGDGEISANDDKKIVGEKRPKWTGGITNTFDYKNLELSFFIFSRWGGTFESGALTLGGRYQIRKVDYWVAGTNEDAKYYSPGSNGESADTYNSSMNYQNATFVKLRNISLAYKFRKSQLKRSGLSNLKIYLQCMNPVTLYSKCHYLDTDLLSYANNTTTTGSPTTIRSMVLGVNIGF